MSVGAVAVRHHATSAALVRHSIADDLAGNAVARDSIDDVVLVASELVGNAVMHTDAECTDDLNVSWEVEPAAVIVRVADLSADLPRQRDPDDAVTGGRGLAIVAAIASDWGVQRSSYGKQVWARVPVQRS
jgi:anti-sigma regulatory factor (Ser/Thr protein kinase)